jgi:type VI secretion system protein ImpH
MADEERTASSALTLYREFAERPWAYDFFQAVRRLECAHRDRPRIGHAQRPIDEPVRFGQEPSLSFAPSTLAQFAQKAPQSVPHMLVYFFGAFGPNGPLPHHLTEYARQRQHHHGDATFASFADMFHHRMLALFYRAWASSRPVVQFDRDDSDRFGAYLASLCGLGMKSLRDRDELPDRAKLFYVGRLGALTRSAEGLRAIVSDYFRMPADVEEFCGEWLSIPPECGWKLGGFSLSRGAPPMGMLGSTALLGPRVWSRQHKFRLVLGPLRYDQFQRMLPGAASLRRLTAMVRNYIGDELHWDLRLTLLKEAMQPTKLGHSGQLGRTSWLLGDSRLMTWEDLIFDPNDEARGGVSDAGAAPSSKPAPAGATARGVSHV